MTKSKPGAPPCGLYYRLSYDEDTDLSTLRTRINQLALVINQRSGYEKNMDVVEIVPDGFSLEVLTDLVQAVQAKGLVAIVYDNVACAKGIGADGVILSDAGQYHDAQRILGEDAIIGVSCRNDHACMQEVLELDPDFVSFGLYGYELPDVKMVAEWTAKTAKPCVALGDVTPDSAGLLAGVGISFIEITRYLDHHPQGTMQAVVNILHALRTAEEAVKTLQ